MFSYPDHRHRIGVNYNQLSVTAPIAPVSSYGKDGAWGVSKVSDPVSQRIKKGVSARQLRSAAPPG